MTQIGSFSNDPDILTRTFLECTCVSGWLPELVLTVIFIVRFIEIRFVVCDASNFSFRLWWRFAIFSKMSHFLTIMASLPSSWTRFHAIFMWKFTPTGTYDSCLEFHPEFLYLAWDICFFSHRKLRRRKSPISECVLIVYRCNLPYFRFVLCWRYRAVWTVRPFVQAYFRSLGFL